MGRLKHNTAEGVGAGTQITAATVAALTGGDSGDAFDSGAIQTNATLSTVFEDMQGSIAYKSAVATGTTAISTVWWVALGNIPTFYGSVLVKIVDVPSAAFSVMEGRPTGPAQVRCGGVGFTTARKVILFGAEGAATPRYTSNLAVNIGETVRIDVRVVGAAGTGGKLQARIWREVDLANATPTETLGADTALWNTTGAIDEVRFGIATLVASADVRWDNAEVWNVWPAVSTGPTLLGFSTTYIGQTSPVGTVAGTFVAVGGAGGNVYELVAGTGSTDNALFTIVGDELRVASALTLGTKAIRVRVTDSAGAVLEEQFTELVVGGSRVYHGDGLTRMFPRRGGTIPVYRRVPPKVQLVAPTFLDKTPTLYVPSVVGTRTVDAAFFNAAPSVYVPTVTRGGKLVSVPYLDKAATFFNSSVSTKVTAVVPYLSRAATFYNPTVTRNVNTVVVPYLSRAATFYNPTVALATPPSVGLRAFPTAEGFGALSEGGRGSGANNATRMTIYKVTNLTDPATRTASYDGSLRWAVEASGPRVIVFGVAGDIVIQKPLIINNPNCTILGHVAPGDGIQLRCAQKSGLAVPFLVNASHVILRYVRSRMFIDPALGTPGASHASIGIANTAGKVMSDIIIDHCSSEWAYDVNLQFLQGRYSDVTVQWCIAAEGYQSAHQRIMSTYIGATADVDLMGPITLHHNLLARGDFRVPQITILWGRTEVINQVAYFTTNRALNINVGAHGAIFVPGKVRVIGCIFTKCANPTITDANTGVSGPANCVSDIKDLGHDENYKVHIDNTIGPGRFTDAQPDIDAIADPETIHYTSDPLCTTAATSVGFPDGKFHHPTIPVTTTSPWQAWHDVLGATTATAKVITVAGGSVSIPAGAPTAGTRPAGASLPVIDSQDQRILDYCKNDTLGATNSNALFTEGLTAPNGVSPGVWPVMSNSPPQAADGGAQAWAPAGDAIPTTWKASNIPGGSFPWSFAPDGYTYAEHYYYSLTGEL